MSEEVRHAPSYASTLIMAHLGSGRLLHEQAMKHIPVQTTLMDITPNPQRRSKTVRGLQRAGGVAALIEAATFIVGFVLFLTLLESEGYGASDTTAEENAAFLADNQGIMYAWNFIIYVLFGIALVVLALALHERLKDRMSGLMTIATPFGLIWSGLVIASGMVANIGASAVVDLYETDPTAAGALWRSLDFVATGLGGGNEIVGGIWVLLISWAARHVGAFSRALSSLGIVIGVSGIITAVPALQVVGAIFGLGLIVWFTWMGIVMLRTDLAPADVHRAALAGAPGQ
jgi:hypothetical protein